MILCKHLLGAAKQQCLKIGFATSRNSYISYIFSSWYLKPIIVAQSASSTVAVMSPSDKAIEEFNEQKHTHCPRIQVIPTIIIDEIGMLTRESFLTCAHVMEVMEDVSKIPGAHQYGSTNGYGEASVILLGDVMQLYTASKNKKKLDIQSALCH